MSPRPDLALEATAADALGVVFVTFVDPKYAPIVAEIPREFFAQLARFQGLQTVDDVTARMEELSTQVTPLIENVIVSRLPPDVTAELVG